MPNLALTNLSIVVVSFNTLEMTRACLESVFSEQNSDLGIEVIVVDNDSHDGSADMVATLFPQVKLIRNPINAGFAAANNLAFRIAQGEYVLLLNSDTLVIGDVLEKSVEYLRSRTSVGAMGCRVLNTDRSMQATCSGYPTLWRLFAMAVALDRLPWIRNHDAYLLRGWARDSEREVEVISGCYLLTRRSVIDQIGALDEDFFFFGEETDWCHRMSVAGWPLMFAPVGEIIHHGGGSVKKLSHRRDLMLTEAIVRLHRKNDGFLAAAVAFLTLAIFNASRAVLWSGLSAFKKSASDRARHFRAVARDTLATWPKPKVR